jgi:SpoVK/Ycf46/Vps4 family AAA+-type ATPase
MIFDRPGGGRFHILYGPGVDDTFINENEIELNLSEALYEELIRRGFERIIFYSPLRSIFFYDERSRSLTQPGRPDNSRLESTLMLQPGPLQTERIHQPTVKPDPASQRGMGDAHALRLLDAAMRQKEGPRTAIIFPQAATTMQFFDHPRLLAAVMGEWANMPSANQNLVCLLYSMDTYNALVEQSRAFPVPELRSIIYRQGNANPSLGYLAHIGGPDFSELKRLLRRVSTHRGKAIHEDQVDLLARRMEAEGTQARYWIQRAEHLEMIDLQTTQQNGWFSANRMPGVTAIQQLQCLVGLQGIKDRVKELEAWMRVIAQRQYEGNEIPALHMIFSGGPGTGKTTVARLFGELLWELGLLKRGHLVEAKGADLVAGHVGGTALKTNSLVDQALDGVLFIDEAYSLTQHDRGGFGAEAVETLLKRMEDERGRFIVIAAGYPDLMTQFRQANPGLARRFPEENILVFPDMDAGELMDVLHRFLSMKKLSFLPEAWEALQTIVVELHRQRLANFGNAGEMRNLAEAMDRKRAARVNRAHLEPSEPLCVEDIPARYLRLLPGNLLLTKDIFHEIDKMVGLETVKKQFRELAASIEYEGFRSRLKVEGATLPGVQHMVFMGNPGTGKTTIARIMGRLYVSLGMLSQGHVVEVSRADLVAGYVGQTALKTLEKVQAAMEGVLFIDEAYSLVQGPDDRFGMEALNTLVKAINENNSRLLIILAGYPQEMRHFLSLNPGLASRLPLHMVFPDLTNDQLILVFKKIASEHGYQLGAGFDERFNIVLQNERITAGHTFGNGRLVRNLFERARRSLAIRVLPSLREVQHSEQSGEVMTRFNTLLPDDLALDEEKPSELQDGPYYFLPGDLTAPSHLQPMYQEPTMTDPSAALRGD